MLWALRASADRERVEKDAAGADTLIRGAVQILATSPLIGREVEHGLRELVISRGKTGYVALYDFIESTETVLILALRHQREAGYSA